MALHSNLASLRNTDRRQLGRDPGIFVVAGSRFPRRGRLFAFWSIAERALVQQLQWIRRWNLFDTLGRRARRRAIGHAIANTVELRISDRRLLARHTSDVVDPCRPVFCNLSVRSSAFGGVVSSFGNFRRCSGRFDLHDFARRFLRAGESVLRFVASDSTLRVRGDWMEVASTNAKIFPTYLRRAFRFLGVKQLLFDLDSQFDGPTYLRRPPFSHSGKPSRGAG